MKKDIIWYDDDISLMISLENEFRLHGFNIIKCTTASQVIEQLFEVKISNLLLDVEFPDSSKEGIHFLKQLKKINPQLNVVIFTGYPEFTDAVKLIKSEIVAHYFAKTDFVNSTKKQEFFKELHKIFKDTNKNNIAIDREFHSKEQFEKKMIKKWRNSTWKQLFYSILIMLAFIIIFLFVEKWNIDNVLYKIENNKLFSISIPIVWGIVNMFIINDLYNKYRNHSNINNYIQKNITSKVPEYLIKN